MIWKALIKIALLGTDRGHLPQSVAADFKKMGIKETDALSMQVLQGAAIVHQMKKAGFPLLSFEKVLPNVLEADGVRNCSARSAHHLNLIVKGTYQPALEEFVFLLLENKRVFPPENLPALFEECLKSPGLWEKVRPVIGQRGEWLFQLNPNWASLAGLSDISLWKTGNRKERIAFLQKMRKHEPKKALSLLQETWEETGFAEQKALLKTLEIGLSDKDETFLEKMLDAKRKELRGIGADLLAKIDRSALVYRVFETLKAQVQFSEKGKIEILLPESLSPALQRDGIDPKTKKRYPGGVKAGWIGQMIAKVPPPFWENHLNLSPVAIIELFEKSHWRDLFNTAVTEACLRFNAPKWQLAIAQNWQKKQDEPAWGTAEGKMLLQQLSDDDFNTLVLTQLKEGAPSLAENSLASHLLCLEEHQWNDRVALQVIKGFQQLIAEADAYYWNLSHYRRILAVGAYRCNAKLFDQFKMGWYYKSPAWSRWEKEVELFMRILRFRMEMVSELKQVAD